MLIAFLLESFWSIIWYKVHAKAKFTQDMKKHRTFYGNISTLAYSEYDLF
ncbi:hypothetical protein QE390_004743 [Siphonobacter sp. SORGH_AS 1065]|nr:hypothetical protein [Siphonobacter sp. SORGH_AS_1065]